MDFPDDLPPTLHPLASLFRKSLKARQKLPPGSWQHGMLEGNLRALHLASLLLTGRNPSFPKSDLEAAENAIQGMIAKTTPGKFAAGSSQHSLLKGRLDALRIAAARVREALEHSR